VNKNQAEAWVKEITNLLTGKTLVSVSVTPTGLDVRQNQKFNNAYIVEHSEENCVIGISDSYGVMTGAKEWELKPNQRMIVANTTNGFDEPLIFAWCISDDDDNGILYREMNEAQKRIWQAQINKPPMEEIKNIFRTTETLEE